MTASVLGLDLATFLAGEETSRQQNNTANLLLKLQKADCYERIVKGSQWVNAIRNTRMEMITNMKEHSDVTTAVTQPFLQYIVFTKTTTAHHYTTLPH